MELHIYGRRGLIILKSEKVVGWFVNYTEQENKGRTVETVMFTKLRDAENFAKNKFGYIIKLTDRGRAKNCNTDHTKATLHKFFGNFTPSATEQLKINHITKEQHVKNH